MSDVPDWLQPLLTAVQTVRAEDLSRFLPPDDGTGRASAVLMLFGDVPGRGPCVLLTERAADLRHHAGQIAFPGGRVEPGDDSTVAAALREAEEEVGLDPAGVDVLATLPDIFIPVTGFVVTPVLAWWRVPGPVAPSDPVEVARVAAVPIAELVDPAHRFRVAHPSGWIAPGFEVDGLFVWGFTAGLLDRLLALAGWAVPWDDSRLRELPVGMVPARPPDAG